MTPTAAPRPTSATRESIVHSIVPWWETSAGSFAFRPLLALAAPSMHRGRLDRPARLIRSLWDLRVYNLSTGSNVFKGMARGAAAIAVLAAAMSADVASSPNLGDENARVAAWRAKRLESLTSETGWLTPIALYWLKDGGNSFGRATTQDFSLDDAALPPATGAFILADHRVRYVAHSSTAMTHLGEPVTDLDLISDVDDKPTELIAGSLHFMLIERTGHLGIRVRDSVSPRRSRFMGLQYFFDPGRLAHRGTLRALCA